MTTMIIKVLLTLSLFVIGLLQTISGEKDKQKEIWRFKKIKVKKEVGIIAVLVIILVFSLINDIIEHSEMIKTKLNNENLTNKLVEIENNTDLVKEITSNTLRSGFFLKAFDRKIRKVELRLILDTIYQSKNVGDFKLAFNFKKLGIEKLNYNYYAENYYVTNSSMNDFFGTNQFKDSLINILIYGGLEGDEILKPFTYTNGNPIVSHITIPLTIDMKQRMDSLKISSLNGAFLKIYLDDNILNKIFSIQLIVNGWAIINQVVKKDEWKIFGMEKSLDWMKKPEWAKQMGLFQRMEIYRGGKTYPPYGINLYNTIPQYYPNKDRN